MTNESLRWIKFENIKDIGPEKSFVALYILKIASPKHF